MIFKAFECFVEFSYKDGSILLLSKIILIVCSVSVALLTVVLTGFYVFNIFVLPTRIVDVLVVWYLPQFTRYALHPFVSFTIDIINLCLGNFLAITYASNFCCILHLFITDSIGKLK